MGILRISAKHVVGIGGLDGASRIEGFDVVSAIKWHHLKIDNKKMWAPNRINGI
jgi:hypothetical protein